MPNVLLILVDQVIADTLGPYGGQCRTPNLDRLAREGAAFDRAFTPLAICSPARASLFTGKLPHNHGLVCNTTRHAYGRPEIWNPADMITRHFDTERIRPGYVGKWHVGTERGPREYGFEGTAFPGYGLPTDFVADYDEYLRERGHDGLRSVRVRDIVGAPGIPANLNLPLNPNMPAGCRASEVYSGVIDLPTELTPAGFVAGRAVESLRACGTDPFFLTVSFWGPHHPAFPSPEFDGRHPPQSLPEWPSFRDELENKPLIQQRYAARLHRTFTNASWETWRPVVARHFDHMAMIDAQIGRVLDELDALGLSDDTVVLFTADHGDTLGIHGGQWDKGPYMYEEVYRVPLLARWPGTVRPGRRIGGLVSNMDLFPTILECLGAGIPDDIDARSLRPLLAGERDRVRDCILAEFYGFDIRGTYFQRMIRTEDRKYVFAPSDVDEFYDLAEDPRELVNRIDDPARRKEIRRLQERLAEEMARAGDPSADPARELMGLGEFA